MSAKAVDLCLANERCGSKLDVGMLIKRPSICCSNSLGQTGLQHSSDSITEISKLYNVLKLLHDVILLFRLYELQTLYVCNLSKHKKMYVDTSRLRQVNLVHCYGEGARFSVFTAKCDAQSSGPS